jgi:hypothetical protein
MGALTWPYERLVLQMAVCPFGGRKELCLDEVGAQNGSATKAVWPVRVVLSGLLISSRFRVGLTRHEYLVSYPKGAPQTNPTLCRNPRLGL